MGIWKILTKKFLANSIMLTPIFLMAGEIDGENSVGAYNDNAHHLNVV